MKKLNKILIVLIMALISVFPVLTGCDLGPLKSPEIELDELNKSISWKRVADSKTYEIYSNDELSDEVKIDTDSDSESLVVYDLTPILNETGVYNFYVIAKTSNKYRSDSEKSNIVTLNYIKKEDNDEESNDEDVIKIDNKSLLKITIDSGNKELRPIIPGDKLAVSISAELDGDYDSGNSTPPSIFVRFKIKLILNFEDRYDVLIPKVSDSWYKFDATKDGGGTAFDDNFYYYCGSVGYQRRIELFSELKVDGNSIDCEDADLGRYGQIQVLVESIEADTNNLSNGIWSTAPATWLSKTIRGDYNLNNN